MVETRSGKETSRYTTEQQEKMVALVRESKERKEREKQAKLKAIVDEQAAKMKRLEEEMKKVQQEEGERRKAAEAEAAAEEEKERMRIESGKGSSSGTMTRETDTGLEKRISEWVANLSLGEDEEAESYVTKDEKAALAAELAAMTDPMERREREEEQTLAWKLRMKREKKKRREEVNKMTTEVAKVQECSAEVLAQPDDMAKWDKVLGYLEVLSKAWMEERQASWSQDVALSAMRSGLRDFACEFVTHIGGEVKQLRDNVGKILDAVELLGKQLDLFRRTRERIGEQLLETLPSGERDEQIRQAMDAAGDLHVSLTSVDAEYKVLRRLMGGVVAIILRPEEAHCGVLRCLARELLACALMKPVMKFASPGYINEVILLLVPSLEERSERHRRACASTPESSAQDKKLRGSPKQTIVIPVQPSDEAPVRTPTPRAAAEAASVPTPGLRPVPTPVPFPPVLASSSLDAQSESMSSSASVGSSGKDRRCSSRNKSRPGSGSGVYDGYKGPAELDGRKIVVCYQENGVVEGAVLSLPHQGKTAMSKRSVSPPMRDTGEMEQARKDQVNKGHLGGVKLDKEETRCKYVDGRSKALVTEHWDGLWTGVDGKGRRQQSALVKGEEKENGGVKTAMAESKSGQERKSEAEGRKRPKRDTVQREKEVVAGPERPASDVFAKVQKGAIMAKERPGSDQSVNASVKSDVEKDESMELLSLKGRRQNEGVNMGEEEDGERYFGSFRQQQRENKFRRLFDDDRVEEIRGIGFLGMEDKGIVWRVGQSCQSTLVARSDPNRSSCSGQRGGMGKAATLEMAQDTENFSGSQQRPSTIHEVKGSSSASQHHQSVSCLPGIEMKLSEEDEMDAVDLDEVDSVSTLRRHGKVNLDRPIPTAQEKKEEIEEVHLKGNRWEDQPVVGRMNEHQRSSSVNLRVAGDRLTLLRRSASDMGCSSSTFDATIKLQAKVVDTWLQEAGLKSFVVYTIFVTHVDGSDWIVNRRYRNFEQLHGVLKEMPQYRLKLPPKLFTGPTGDP
ncbi:hypothetical protein CBR_g32698 [Chara braunii]|uniref:PX domain-containing protein n=1 Tax=Chara braunii TaxID=69332 RepID=A0A388LHH7_CHABU|nr:hypothetical protein CBR_g32698 [Chara braunii]|eukprot:GBG81705.1 hypothetical protein CBR_g32698 [Chara braunii]